MLAKPNVVVALAMAGAVSLTVVSTRGQGPSGGRPPGSRAITVAQARDAVDQIARDLREARKMTNAIAEKATRDRLELVLARAELRAIDLREELGKVPDPPAGPRPLTEEEFAHLLKGVSAQPFDKDKLIQIQNFGTARPLTCAQAAGLLKSFNFDEDRGKAAILLYPRLTDRLRFQEVLDVFVFDLNRKKVREAVGLK